MSPLRYLLSRLAPPHPLLDFHSHGDRIVVAVFNRHAFVLSMYLAWRLKIAENRWFFSSAMSLRSIAATFLQPRERERTVALV